MCLGSVHPPGKRAVERHLRNGLETNYEGAGYAVWDGDFLSWNRQLDGERMLEEFLVMRELYPQSWGIFHSRLSTGSAVTSSRCHPVPAGGWLIFHNGSLPSLDTSERSDTQVFAEDILPRMLTVFPDKQRMADWIGHWAGRANKIALLHQDHGVLIVNRREWFEEDGVLHTNADYLGRGVGWEEHTDENGDVHRWNIVQPGQCPRCHSLACRGCDVQNMVPPRYRNETRRMSGVARLYEYTDTETGLCLREDQYSE